jgi:alkylated DNA nucleotide flippase Atl1
MRKIVPLILIAMTACAADRPQRISIDQIPAGAVCDDRALGSFIGQPASAEIATKLMGFSRSHTLRWVPVGGMVTMDYSPQRLTVQLDQQNRIASLKCG